MKFHTNALLKTAAILSLTASFAFAYPDAGTMAVNGPSDFVGSFTISNGAQSFSGYGGGYLGTVTDTVTNRSATQLLFCDDFSNDISIPSGQIAVNISQLTTGSDISKTRFGSVSVANFQTVNLSLTNTQASALTVSTENALNGATALQRYQMAAYLVTLYSFLGDHPAANSFHSDSVSRGIQDAIWTLLDAKGETFTPPSESLQAGQTGDVTTYLTAAANWLSSGDKSFLSQFSVITDASMHSLNSGVQELLLYTSVPEPGYGALLGLALLGLGWTARRHRRA
jgi:hypothetical protein